MLTQLLILSFERNIKLKVIFVIWLVLFYNQFYTFKHWLFDMTLIRHKSHVRNSSMLVVALTDIVSLVTLLLKAIVYLSNEPQVDRVHAYSNCTCTGWPFIIVSSMRKPAHFAARGLFKMAAASQPSKRKQTLLASSQFL